MQEAKCILPFFLYETRHHRRHRMMVSGSRTNAALSCSFWLFFRVVFCCRPFVVSFGGFRPGVSPTPSVRTGSRRARSRIVDARDPLLECRVQFLMNRSTREMMYVAGDIRTMCTAMVAVRSHRRRRAGSRSWGPQQTGRVSRGSSQEISYHFSIELRFNQ